MYKYVPKRGGGWFAAEVADFDDEREMVRLDFEIDEKVEWHVLERSRYTSSPAAAIRSCVLLEERPLHDVPSDMP
eukprot:347986-Prymnesium_polylepis.1